MEASEVIANEAYDQPLRPLAPSLHFELHPIYPNQGNDGNSSKWKGMMIGMGRGIGGMEWGGSRGWVDELVFIGCLAP